MARVPQYLCYDVSDGVVDCCYKGKAIACDVETVGPLSGGSVPVTWPCDDEYIYRCVRANSDSIASTTRIEQYMKIRVRLPTYKIVYESGSEDFLWRKRDAEEWRVLEERDRARREERGKCCWLCA